MSQIPEWQIVEALREKLDELRKSSQFDDALKEVRKFKHAYPDYYVGYFDEAKIYRQLNSYRNAIEQIDIAKRLIPKNTPASYSVYFSAGEIYMEAGLLHEAVPLLEKARGHSFFTEESDWYLTEVYIKIGDRSKAKKCLERLPDNFERVYMLGRPKTTRAFLEEEVARLGRRTE